MVWDFVFSFVLSFFFFWALFIFICVLCKKNKKVKIGHEDFEILNLKKLPEYYFNAKKYFIEQSVSKKDISE